MDFDEFPEFRNVEYEKMKRRRKCLIVGSVILLFVIWVLISNSIRQKEIEKQRREWVSYVQELPRHGEQRNFGDTKERERTIYNFTSPAIAWNVLIRFLIRRERFWRRKYFADEENAWLRFRCRVVCMMSSVHTVMMNGMARKDFGAVVRVIAKGAHH